MNFENRIEISGEVATPEFWLAKNPGGDEIILSPSEIEQLNSKILAADDYAENLLSYPEKISGADVKAKIRQLTDDVKMYDFKNLFFESGEPVPDENFQSVKEIPHVEADLQEITFDFGVDALAGSSAFWCACRDF